MIQQHLKSARRRVPRDHAGPAFSVGANLGLDKDCNEQFSTCYQHGVKITKTLQYLLKSALHAITENGGRFFFYIDFLGKSIFVIFLEVNSIFYKFFRFRHGITGR